MTNIDHTTAINELTLVKNALLNNATIAHGEGNQADRDHRLTKAFNLINTIRHLEEEMAAQDVDVQAEAAVEIARSLWPAPPER